MHHYRWNWNNQGQRDKNFDNGVTALENRNSNEHLEEKKVDFRQHSSEDLHGIEVVTDLGGDLQKISAKCVPQKYLKRQNDY